jgi:nucleoid-associated protein YgaU
MWPFGKSLNDRVKDAINQWPPLQGLGLEVSENGGNVSVSGAVPRQPHMDLLKAAVQGIKGMKSADFSGVVVGQQDVSDADIAAAEAEVKQALESSQLAKKVLAALEANGELADDPIDVLQSGSGVVLRGAVDNQHELNLAVQIAQSQGATSVDTSGLKIHEGARAKFAGESGYVNIPDEWYTVQSGDTLSEIAQKFYGDASRDSYMKIAKANNLANPDLIKVGQKLQIPR